MNRRLFWKIFLPFWVAQALLLGALYLRIHYRISSEHPWWIQPERREMPVLANLAAQTFEQQGQGGLVVLLDQMSLPNRARFWLVDADGRELSGREIPQRVLDDAAKAEKTEGLHHSYEANVLAAAATTARAHYLLIAELVPPPLSERSSRRHSLDLEAGHHFLGAGLSGDRPLSDQADRASAGCHP